MQSKLSKIAHVVAEHLQLLEKVVGKSFINVANKLRGSKGRGGKAAGREATGLLNSGSKSCRQLLSIFKVAAY